MAQSSHAADSESRGVVDVAFLPAAQEVQLTALMLSLYFPAAQSVQPVSGVP